MDLSWCIICDRHCVEDNLYCSDSCRRQDTCHSTKSKPDIVSSSPPVLSPPSSPHLAPFLTSFTTGRAKSMSRSYVGYATLPASPESMYSDR